MKVAKKSYCQIGEEIGDCILVYIFAQKRKIQTIKDKGSFKAKNI